MAIATGMTGRKKARGYLVPLLVAQIPIAAQAGDYKKARIVHGVLARALLAAQVGWVVQPVRSCRAE